MEGSVILTKLVPSCEELMILEIDILDVVAGTDDSSKKAKGVIIEQIGTESENQ